MTIQKKINHLTNTIRKIWPKYDVNLTQHVRDTDKIIQLIEHTFKESMLSSDFQNLNISNDINSLQKFIEEEAKYSPVNTECQNGQNDEIALNQAKILNVIKRFYGDPSARW